MRLVACAVALLLAALPLRALGDEIEAPPNAAVADLTNLTFSATGDLSATLVSPRDGESAANPIEVATVAGAGVELTIEGSVVPFSHIGKRTVNRKTGETHYFYYGVTLQPGPNRIVLTPLGANGLRGARVYATLFGPAQITALRAVVDGKLRSDGKTPVALRVFGTDAWRHAAGAGALVKVEVMRGDVTVRGARDESAADTPEPEAATAPLAPTTLPASPAPAGPRGTGSGGSAAASVDATGAGPGTSATGRTGADGTVVFSLLPGLRPGDVFLRVTAGDVVLDTQTRVVPYLRVPLVNGLVTGGVGSVPGIPGEDPTAPDGGNSRRARAAIYASGAAGDDTLVTVAYDTAGVLDQQTGSGAFLSNPDERPYQTYGDASARRDDALSTNHLYARVDEQNLSAMWGEFRAQTASAGQSSLGGFDLLVNGARVAYANATTRASLFNAHDAVAYARQLFQPTGLSTLTGSLEPDIVVGSEVVELIALDRRTGAVGSDIVLTRNVDYTLDYATGDLRFINVPLPFDDLLNPQEVLVRYQYRGPNANAETTGGRIDTAFGTNGAFQAGAGYANDATGSGSVTLLGENVGGKLPGGTWSLEHLATGGANAYGDADAVAAATGVTGTSGDAWKAALASSFANNRLSLGFESTSLGFDDPYGGLSTPGLTSENAAFVHALRGGDVSLAFDRERNVGTAGNDAETNVALRAHRTLGKRLTVGAGVEYRRFDAGTGTVAVASIPAIVPAAPASGAPASGVAFANATLTTPSGSVTQADLSAAYKISPVVDVQASRIENVGGDAASTASQPAQTSAQLGIDFPNKGRAYVREIWSDAPTQSFAASTGGLTAGQLGTRSTALGFERSLGAATTVDTEYGVEGTGSGSDVYSSIGVKERFLASKQFKGDVALQKVYALGAGLSGANVYATNVSYSPNDRFKSSLAYDLRTGDTPGSSIALGAAGKIARNLSLLGAIDQSRAAGFSSVNDGIGLAFRPTDGDRFDALLEFQKVEGNDSTLDSRSDLASYEQFVRLGRSDLSARIAYKLDGDGYYPAHSSLFGVRFATRLTGRFDIAEELRVLQEAGLAAASASGFAVETGYRLSSELRLATGYNFATSADPNLTTAPQRRGPYGTITSVFDTLGNWGRTK